MKWFRNLKVGTKLIVTFLVVAVIAGAIGVLGIININTLNDNDTLLYEENTLGIIYSSDASISYQRMRFYALTMTIAEDSKRDSCIENIKKYHDEAEENLKEYEASIISDIDRQQFNELYQIWGKYNEFVSNATQLVLNGDKEQALKLINNDAADTATLLQASFQKLFDYNRENASERSKQNDSTAQSSGLFMIILVGIGVIVSIVFGLFVSRMISKPVKILSKAADKLSNGETDVVMNIDAKDEIGILAKSFGNVVESIKALIMDANMLASEAVEGRLSARADEKKHKGDYRKIIEGVNRTLDSMIKPINEASDVLTEVAKGNLGLSMEGEYKGDHSLIKDALNETISTLGKYIKEISMVLGEISKGNLDVEITGNFKGDFIELKDSINGIVSSLNSVLSEINASADQVAVGTTQVSEGSQAISQGATEQASSIEELSASITQIAAQTKQNATNANKATELANAAKNNAFEGNSRMKNLQKAMTEINESSKNISKIIKVIDDIAFQTNILALNAAVEAARAGTHGKGFAVVAEEVRNLAGKSADAAKDTTALIEGSIQKVEVGTKIADETAVALENIVDGAEKSVQLVSDIAAASNEQASGIAQINNGIEQLSQVVQTNSATAEEGAAASEELSGQAELLKSLVGNFKLKTKTANNMNKLTLTLGEKKSKDETNRIILSDSDFGKY